jgi:hypothetical protein
MEQIPEDFPPRVMFDAIAAIREDTRRIRELLEKVGDIESSGSNPVSSADWSSRFPQLGKVSHEPRDGDERLGGASHDDVCVAGCVGEPHIQRLGGWTEHCR